MDKEFIITKYDLDQFNNGSLSENFKEIIDEIIKELPKDLQTEAATMEVKLVKTDHINSHTDTYEVTFANASQMLQKSLKSVYRFITIYVE
ncbi:MAG TPA: hypothetical protein VGA67_03685 [Candidatus Dojkabacteria bacterium]|jgi:hypothetical protein